MLQDELTSQNLVLVVGEGNDLRADKLTPIAILYNCLGEHDLLLTDHLDVTFVVTVDYFKLLA
jgi:hypothetical protein